MQQLEDQLAKIAKENFDSANPCPGGPLILELRPGREWLARQVAAKYGREVALFVALTTWDGRPGRSPVCGLLPDPTSWPRGLRLALRLGRSSVASGSDFAGTIRVSELGPGTLSMNIGQPLQAVLVREGTRRVVGVYTEGIAGSGMPIELRPGGSASVPVLGGTARCDGGIGSAVPPGTYGATVLVDNEGVGPTPEYLTPLIAVRVLPQGRP